MTVNESATMPAHEIFSSQPIPEELTNPAPRAPSIEVAPKPKRRLIDLLKLLSDADAEALTEFDPAEVVGELKDKIDAIYEISQRLEQVESWNRLQAEPFLQFAKRAKSNRERLREYVTYAMQSEKFDVLPGLRFKAVMQPNPPALVVMQSEPTALDFKNLPQYVRVVRRYEWDTAAIKDALLLKARELAGPEADITDEHHEQAAVALFGEVAVARITVGKHVRFRPNPPAVLESKKGAKK
jgi:hypothetical protein